MCQMYLIILIISNNISYYKNKYFIIQYDCSAAFTFIFFKSIELLHTLKNGERRCSSKMQKSKTIKDVFSYHNTFAVAALGNFPQGKALSQTAPPPIEIIPPPLANIPLPPLSRRHHARNVGQTSIRTCRHHS